jgi:putative endonuclease
MRRVWEHKNKIYPGFSATYECNKLVYYEDFQYIQDAIEREKQLKAGNRAKKTALINTNNPNWRDLSDGWYDQAI